MELREAFESTPDLMIVWVMSEAQVNERTRIFVDELGLRFPVDRHRVEALFAEIKKVHDGLYSAADWSLGVPRPPQTVEGMLTFSAEHPTTLKWRHMPFLEMKKSIENHLGKHSFANVGIHMQNTL